MAYLAEESLFIQICGIRLKEVRIPGSDAEVSFKSALEDFEQPPPDKKACLHELRPPSDSADARLEKRAGGISPPASRSTSSTGNLKGIEIFFLSALLEISRAPNDCGGSPCPGVCISPNSREESSIRLSTDPPVFALKPAQTIPFIGPPRSRLVVSP